MNPAPRARRTRGRPRTTVPASPHGPGRPARGAVAAATATRLREPARRSPRPRTRGPRAGRRERPPATPWRRRPPRHDARRRRTAPILQFMPYTPSGRSRTPDDCPQPFRQSFSAHSALEAPRYCSTGSITGWGAVREDRLVRQPRSWPVTHYFASSFKSPTMAPNKDIPLASNALSSVIFFRAAISPTRAGPAVRSAKPTPSLTNP